MHFTFRFYSISLILIAARARAYTRAARRDSRATSTIAYAHRATLVFRRIFTGSNVGCSATIVYSSVCVVRSCAVCAFGCVCVCMCVVVSSRVYVCFCCCSCARLLLLNESGRVCVCVCVCDCAPRCICSSRINDNSHWTQGKYTYLYAICFK